MLWAERAPQSWCLSPSAQLLSQVRLFATPRTVAHQAPLSMGFSRHKYWSVLPFPPPGGLPDPGKETTSLVSPALAGGFFTTAPPGKPIWAQEGPLIAQKSELHNTGDTPLETAIGGAAYGDPVSSHHRTPLPGLLEHTSTHFEHLLCARLRAKNRA